MRLLRVAFKTLGCKLNQLETESVAEAFAQAGMCLVSAAEDTDLLVVNTCTVTGKAEQKARHAIRHALARNPQSIVLVTGCYAQMDPEGLSSIDPRSVVLPGEEKSTLLELASWLQDNWQGHGDLHEAILQWKAGRSGGGDPFAFHPARFAFHSRPSLKIEDGCNNRCSYCRVCLARGRAVSLPARLVLERARLLEQQGKTEVVLTGINLSQYRDGELRFPQLLAHLLANTERLRFRISSWEPEHVDNAFLDVFAHPRVQPHIHLALQSGSTAVLRRMARSYSAEKAADAIRALRSVRDDPFIAADIIAGFPGETDEEFAETLAFCHEADFAWIHAFPFSARPGTKAWDMKPKIPERIAGERVAALASLAAAGAGRYVTRWTGKTTTAILEKEGNRDEDGGVSEGGLENASTGGSAEGSHEPAGHSVFGTVASATSANYLKLRIPVVDPSLTPGCLVKVRILGIPDPDRGHHPTTALAEICNPGT
jgi:threonylcarbamoyladenosine tRNA methylthiotransferase MtaB